MYQSCSIRYRQSIRELSVQIQTDKNDRIKKYNKMFRGKYRVEYEIVSAYRNRTAKFFHARYFNINLYVTFLPRLRFIFFFNNILFGRLSIYIYIYKPYRVVIVFWKTPSRFDWIVTIYRCCVFTLVPRDRLYELILPVRNQSHGVRQRYYYYFIFFLSF